MILSQSGGSGGFGLRDPCPGCAVGLSELAEVRPRCTGRRFKSLCKALHPLLPRVWALRRVYGVIVSDVIPGGPAEAAGLKIGDILVGADDRPTDTLPALYAAMYLHPIDEVLKIAVKRGSEQKTLYIPVLEHRDQMDKLMDAVDPEKSLVPRLGILAIDLKRAVSGPWSKICEFPMEWSSSPVPQNSSSPTPASEPVM